MKVYLQVNNKGLPLDYDHFNAAYGFREMGFEIVEFETYDTLKKSEINDVIVGYSGPIETRLYDFGVRIPDIDYPESISGYLGRKIWKFCAIPCAGRYRSPATGENSPPA